jgi:hypothetical protein
MKDFDPVALLAIAPLWLVGTGSIPATDLKGLIAWLPRARPWQGRPVLAAWRTFRGHTEDGDRSPQCRSCRSARGSGLGGKLVALGQEVPPRSQQTPEALAAYHRAEMDRWLPIMKTENIRPQ